MIKSLHIVSFDNPYPANYGGVIDIYYKIKALHSLEISIHLHIFSIESEIHPELKKYCSNIHFYKRRKSFISLFSTTPYRVKDRSSKMLIKNLTLIKCPILFEGLHTTSAIINHHFQDQKVFVRTHNIEHLYLKGLSKTSKNLLHKISFYIEGIKFKHYEVVLNKVDGIFTIAPFEQTYFKKKYNTASYYIPVFHENTTFNKNKTKNKSVLFHGDLRVIDNIKASLFFINVFKKTNVNFLIASSTADNSVLKQISKYNNCNFIKIKNNQQLDSLLENTHINVLFTFQKTGIKLKLINALYKGKFVIVNNKMIEETGLEDLCFISNSKEELLKETNALLKETFTENSILNRIKKLGPFDTQKNARKIIDVIFN